MLLSFLRMENRNMSDEIFSSLLYLSRISAEENERRILSSQVGNLIGYFKILDKYADNSLDNSMYAAQDEQALRSNEIKESLPQSGLKKMSSEYMDNYFRVPKVLGSGS